MDKIVDILDVEDFWDHHPCEADAGRAADRKKYFVEIEKYRYSHNPTIPRVSNFEGYKGKKVLEIGCGIGTDGRQFTKNGAIYTGINLDRASTVLAKEAFKLFELEGEIYQVNAENLEFPNNTFDHVFSMGVIHHTPSTEKVVKEMFRVLKPGGTVSVMIYNKTSINYYFEIMFLRKIFRLLLIPSFAPGLIAKITGFSRAKLERHRQLFLNEKKITKQRWISMNTDGPDNPLSKVYTKKEADKLFVEAGFILKRNFSRYFNKTHYGFLGKLIPGCIANGIGNLWGWHRWIEAVKPQD